MNEKRNKLLTKDRKEIKICKAYGFPNISRSTTWHFIDTQMVELDGVTKYYKENKANVQLRMGPCTTFYDRQIDKKWSNDKYLNIESMENIETLTMSKSVLPKSP